MPTLLGMYIALSVFGLGVTVVDFLGFLEHSGDSSGDASTGDGVPSDSGLDSDTSAGDSIDGDAGVSDASAADDGSAGEAGGLITQDGSADNDAGSESDSFQDQDSLTDGGRSLLGSNADKPSTERNAGALQTPKGAARGLRAVTRVLSTLRLLVYFALGAGPAGLFATLTGLSTASSLLWAGGTGIVIATLARLLRRFIRRDLDSSIKPEELLMEKALLLLPLSPGQLGKAAAHLYGREQEIYIKAEDPSLSLPKGATVSIVNYADGVYYITDLKEEI